ncbi:MAG TPA: 30S ribosomal protein S27ae [Candidatus Nanoarchaeia archaeon]|nr:30S ribosomal protein S27ae [Candidatus Nanoarchaeia archaeon]
MAKKKVKNRKPSERWKKYKISGNKIERGKTCPKCGPGMFLAVHKDRVYCGKCHYAEWTSKK